MSPYLNCLIYVLYFAVWPSIMISKYTHTSNILLHMVRSAMMM